MSFYSKEELQKLEFKTCGDNVFISRNASFYSPELMSFGDNVRIDDFCILSGNIKLGNNIHISAYSSFYGRNGIIIHDFSTLSVRTIIFSASDDFSGEHMHNPTIPSEYTNVTGGVVEIEEQVLVGANSIILPNVTLSEGTIIGAMSLVNKSTKPWHLYAGIPIKEIRELSKNSKILKEQFLSNAKTQ